MYMCICIVCIYDVSSRVFRVSTLIFGVAIMAWGRWQTPCIRVLGPLGRGSRTASSLTYIYMYTHMYVCVPKGAQAKAG